MSTKSKHDAKVEKVMSEFKNGRLKSSSGQQVTSRKQAIAIALSEAGRPKKAADAEIAGLQGLGRDIVHTHLAKAAEHQQLVATGRELATNYVKEAVFQEFKRAMDADKSEGDATLDATEAPETGKPDKDGQRTAARVKETKVKKDGETALADQKTAEAEYLTGALATLIETCKEAGVDFKSVLAQVQEGI
jgi:hypothetical protein